MMDREEVLRCARLARIELNEEEIETFERQLGSILVHFERLRNAPTEGVSPGGILDDLHDTLRDDLPGDSLDHEAILRNGPKRKGPYFAVPKVITG